MNLHDSTQNNLATWWKAHFSQPELKWWRQHASHLPAQPALNQEESIVDPESLGSFGWRKMNCGSWAPCVRIKLTDQGEYDPIAAYELSRKDKDVLLSPHSRLRSMSRSNNFHVIDFVRDFGPLLIDSADFVDGERSFWLSLDDFWSMHARFCLVTKLWESQNDIGNLRSSWRELHARLEEVLRAFAGTRESEFAPFLVSWESAGIAATFESATHHIDENVFRWPWKMDDSEFQNWIRTVRADVLRSLTAAVVNRELNLRMQDRRPYWQSYGPQKVIGFRLQIEEGSLWSLIWEFFGRDTSQGLAWRICRHCEQIFYPSRINQKYCDSEDADRFIKREWARKKRAGKPSAKSGGR
jgi:hypothetical protein